MRALAVIILTTVCAVSACAHGAAPPIGTVGISLDDARVAAAVRSALLADPDLGLRDIAVDVDRGVVSLSGVVRTADEVQRAATVTQRAAGVREVKSGSQGRVVADPLSLQHPEKPTMTMLDTVGNWVAQAAAWCGELSLFAARSIREVFRPPYEVGETLRQLYELGVRSVPLITVAGLAVGVVLSMHTRASLERFGAEAMIPAGLALALVKETGPLTAGLLLSGRIGAGIGAEIGAMKVTEQIDALEATAVDSFKYLVVTRMVACVVALPILTTMMNGAGIVGGYLAEATLVQTSPQLYFDRAFSLVDFADLVPATLKTAVFGFIIAIVSSFLGMTTTQGTEGVGRASTRSVVMSSVVLIVVNVVLVRLIFLLFPETA